MFEKDDSASTALISFMLGGVAGAALAVLFAPGAGSDTRRRLGAGVRGGAERGRALVRRGRAALDAAGVSYVIDTYENARHGFAVNGHLVYDKEASERHWERLLRLLQDTLQSP